MTIEKDCFKKLYLKENIEEFIDFANDLEFEC